jgi:energy-coupling factor transporter ATP-binding protein EcfA2
MHAAGVLVGARAFLLVGPSGCGKTTWARTAAEAGLPVLSDDCVLVDSVDGRLMALGSPFRAKDFPSPGPGRWPVAAILLPQPAPAPALTPVTRLMLEARVAANLLFSAAAWDAQPAAARAASLIAAGAPARILAFRPDPSWIEVVASIE